MGRPGYACRDKWRMMKNNPKTGEWSEDEVKRLRVRPHSVGVFGIYCRVRETYNPLIRYIILFSLLLQELVEEYFDAQQAGPGRGGA